MTAQEKAILAVVQEKQREITVQIAELRRDMKQNNADTAAIKSALDNLTGGKQALMWFTGLVMSILVVIATWLGFHKQ